MKRVEAVMKQSQQCSSQLVRLLQNNGGRCSGVQHWLADEVVNLNNEGGGVSSLC